MRKSKKFPAIFACGVVAVMILALAGPGGNSATRNGDSIKIDDLQLVYAELDHSGSVQGMQILDQLSLSGQGTITVETPLALAEPPKIQGVSGFSTPKVEDDTLVWKDMKVDGLKTIITNNKISKGQLETEMENIPLEVNFKYWLDGRRVDNLKDIAGKSGHFKMELSMTNTSKEKTRVTYTDSITGEEVTTTEETYLPLVIQPYDWYFDNQVFFNMECDETGIIFSLPTDYQIGWTIPLFPPATPNRSTISVEADVKNFSMKPLTLAIAFLYPHTNQINPMPTIKSGLSDLYGGVDELGTGLAEATAGVGTTSEPLTLLGGISAMDSGLSQMASELPPGKAKVDNTMIPGVQGAVTGIGSPETDLTLLYAENKITEGLYKLSAGIGSIDNPESLVYAANAVSAGLTEISTNIGSAAVPLTLLGGLATISAGIGSATTANTLLFASNAVSGGLADIQTNIGTAASATTTIAGGLAAIQASIVPLSAGVSTIVQGLTVDAGATTMLGYLNLIKPAIDTLDPAYYLNLVAYMDQYAAGLNTVNAGLATISASIGSAAAPLTLLGGLAIISAGIGSATTADTLLFAENSIAGGLADIQTNIGTAASPATTIAGGLAAIQTGIGSATTDGTLLYATNAISAGLAEMLAGIGSPTTDLSLLYASNQVFSGLSLMKSGLSTGSAANPGLLEGLVQISDGFGESIAGLGSYSTSGTLLYGAGKVSSGLAELKSGLELAVSDGTDVMKVGLVDSLTQMDLTDGELAAIEQRGEEFDSFLGRVEEPDDAGSQVRFLMTTKPVQSPWTGSSWILALILSCLGAAALVLLGLYAWKKFA